MQACSESINLLQADLKHRMSVFAQTDNSPEGQVQSQRQHLLTISQLWRLLEGQLVSIAGHLAPCMPDVPNASWTCALRNAGAPHSIPVLQSS